MGRQPQRAVSGILLFDKPLGLSSNQALQKVRRIYQAEKAGHTGSLDPLATGMLPICLGQATKLSGFLLDSDKRYRAQVRLGERTSTGDAEGEVVERSDAEGATLDQFEAVLPQFRGRIRQRPPMHSALKHQGRRLYELAREGIEVERESRELEITHLAITRFGAGELELEVHCSKGTYIRTLAEDIAGAAGHCAHLAGLRRMEVSPFAEGAMVTLEALDQVAAAGGEAALDKLLLPPAAGLAGWRRVVVDAAQAARLGHGQAVAAEGLAGPVAVLDGEGVLLGIADIDGAGRLAPRRWLV